MRMNYAFVACIGQLALAVIDIIVIGFGWAAIVALVVAFINLCLGITMSD